MQVPPCRLDSASHASMCDACWATIDLYYAGQVRNRLVMTHHAAASHDTALLVRLLSHCSRLI